MPKVIQLKQGSDQWHELRSNHIGASCAGIIMDCDPYRTRNQLWLEMIGIGEKQIENGAMRRGKELESVALDLYNQERGLSLRPMVIQSDIEPFMIASLDGITENLNSACEIKCLSLENHNKEKILPHHFAQMQHQLFVLGLNELDYVSYHPDATEVKPLYILKVKRDEEFLMDYIPKAKAFWNCVQTFTAPDLCAKDYRDFSSNPDYRAAEAAYVDICDKLDKLEEQKEQVRIKLLDMSEGNNIQGAYTKMTQYVKKANIPYAKLEEVKQLDLEKYRPAPVSSTRITKV